MPQLPFFDEDDVRRLAPMGAAIDALRNCFAASPTHIARSLHPAAGGEFMLMPAVDGDAAGIKLLMVQPHNFHRGQPIIQGTYVLFDADAGCPVALLDGAALTRVRTPATSAVATDALARADATTLGVIGTGPQARGHIEAMMCVRPRIQRIVVASRSADKAAALADVLRADTGLAFTGTIGGGSIAEAAACDVVCTATRATEPLLTRAMVRDGTHINAVGAYRTDMRELTADLVAACTVVVDETEAAHEEAGDLALAVADGAWTWDRVAGDLVAMSSGVLRRTSADEITFFKSVGLALQDLIVARMVASAGIGPNDTVVS